MKAALRRLREFGVAFWYRGKGRYCPVCGVESRRFRPYGSPPRQNARCTVCGALERHRLLWLFLERRSDLFDGKAKTMLHVAPEPSLEPRFRKALGDDYITADRNEAGVSVNLDITNIPFADRSFHVIQCNHVLEHVPEDRKAMGEFFRVLREDGWAVLLVPITAQETVEDPSIVDPEERKLVFGQEDHVRRYGPDYVDRLIEAGFQVEKFTVSELAEGHEVTRMGLTEASGEIFFCRR